MKKWCLLYGFVSFVIIFCLVLIFFWWGEPLCPLDRTNNPYFLAYFLHITTLWFLAQAISLTFFWNKWISTTFPKWATYIFWFFSFSFLGFSLVDTYVSYFQSGFWVTWIRVVSDQKQTDLLLQKGLSPILFLLVLILFLTITIFIVVFKKRQPQNYVFPVFFSILSFIGLFVACMGLLLIRESFYLNGSAIFSMAHMSDFLPFQYIGRTALYLLISIYMIYLAFVLDR